MDLRLTNYDLNITNGELSFVTGAEAIAQHVTMRLRTWLGECVYARNIGVPYTQVIFARKNPDLAVVHATLDQVIRSVPGVLDTSFTVELDSSTRTLIVSGTIQSIDGEIDFSFQGQGPGGF